MAQALLDNVAKGFADGFKAARATRLNPVNNVPQNSHEQFRENMEVAMYVDVDRICMFEPPQTGTNVTLDGSISSD